jgi:hypothetical protein
MRASDDDRQRVVAALEEHTGAGRLTLDEFAERVGVVAGARTLGELAAVVSDLPGDPISPASAPAASTIAGAEPKQSRELLWVFAIAIGAVFLLVFLMGLRS